MENRLKGDFRSSSSFYASKSGFITTFQGGEEEDIRKSRIEHLPSYRKENLSGKLQFVVVFQTMEIERLSLEIESLRVMLKDADRQLHNYLNYEVQIKELTENCHQLEEQRANYQTQIEQVSLACNSLYQQLADSKRSYERDLDDLAARAEAALQQKDQQEREAQAKAKAISQELVRLNQSLYEGQGELAQLREQARAKEGALREAGQEREKDRQQLSALLQENDCVKGEFFTLQEEYGGLCDQLGRAEQANEQLSAQLEAVTAALGREKSRAEEIGSFAQELQARIEEKSGEVSAFQRQLLRLGEEWSAKSRREDELGQKLLALEPVLAQNGSLQEAVCELDCRVAGLEEQLREREQRLLESEMASKEAAHQLAQLQTASERGKEELRQLQQRLEKERQSWQSERRRAAAELQRESGERRGACSQRDQLKGELQRLLAEGVVREELRGEVRRLGERCRRQEGDIGTMKGRFEGVQATLRKLRERCASFNEVEKTNTLLRKQLDASLLLTDQMLKRMASLQQEVETLTDENWRLGDRLREEASKDEFSLASSKTISSVAATGSTLAAQPRPAVRGRTDYSPAGLATERLSFNAEVGRGSKAKSILGEELGARRVLEPSSYFPSRDSNYSSAFSSAVGQLSGRESAYGLQRRERR